MNLDNTELPNEYVSDVDAEDEELLRAEDDLREDMDELHKVFEIHMANMMLVRLAIDNKITLAEYESLADILMEYEKEHDITIL